MSVPIGRYRHYKGRDYIVLGVARHSETEDELVVYRQDYGERALWVRPQAMFQETVKIDGEDVPRFRYLGSSPADGDGAVRNLLTNIPASLPEELVQTILAKSDLRLERVVSHGHASPPGFCYDQDQHEWVLLIQGAARLQVEDQVIELKPGDYINIPAHRRHRVDWTTPNEETIWLAVFYED